MLVSVVINNYNYGRFLAESIASALAQTHPTVEVIVVDDGSTDHSRDVIAGFGGRIIPLLKTNGGQGSALNAGFAASRGEIVLFLDADDYLYPHALKQIVARWDVQCAKVHFQLTRIDADHRDIGLEPRHGQRLPNGEVWPDFLRDGRYVTPATSGSAYPRRVLASILPMPEVPYIYAADAYLNNRVIFHGPLSVIREPLGVYRVHGTNDSLGNVLSADIPRVRYLMSREMHNDAAFLAEIERREIAADPEARYRFYQRLKLRVLSWKLDRATHPKRSDSLVRLVRMAGKAVWGAREMSSRERVLQTLWFGFVFSFPAVLVSWALRNGSRVKEVLKPAAKTGRRSAFALPTRA